MRSLDEMHDQKNDEIYENVYYALCAYQPTNFNEVV